jgi:hypothetical protein
MRFAGILLAIPASLLGCRERDFEDRNGNGRDELLPGLVGEYYAVGKNVSDFPDVGKREPTLRRVDRQIDFGIGLGSVGGFSDTGLADYFYARWTGVLRVTDPGPYTFFLQSDDGSRLYVDGKRVVDNGGAHTWRERSGTVDLKPGDHDLKVEFFENDGLAGCVLSWDPPGGDRQVIPADRLLHRRDRRVDRDQGSRPAPGFRGRSLRVSGAEGALL